MKIPIKLYQRCMAKVSSFWLIRFVFHATAVTRNHSKDSKFLQLVCKRFTRFWISKQASGSEYTRAHNMPRLWILICEGYTGCWICLNKSEYALMIFQYAWLSLLTLNMIECGGIYLKKKRVLNTLEFWMCRMQYIAEGYCTNDWAVIETETYSEHCQAFKMEGFAKRTISECKCTTRTFSGQGRMFVELAHFDKCLVRQKHKKKRPHTETFWSFCS